MAAAMADPRGSGVAAEESGSEWSSGLPEDSFSSEEEALEGDDEDEALCTVDENSAKSKLDKKREWEMMCRVKPDVAKDRDKERDLQRIATRGIVQLFNAVRKHQNNVDEKVKEAGNSNRKRAKLMSSVSKKDFIDVLRGMEGTKREQNIAKTAIKKKQGEVKSDEGPAWNVLRDDFMMGASMKDWDKDSDQESDAAQDNRLRPDTDGTTNTCSISTGSGSGQCCVEIKFLKITFPTRKLP
ncbi:RRP15-like protein [Alligator mississippiensis]|uniref:RRP15-like protein n=1 Tax=Alligator mississippiensis TaxID=8496 RepID=A0A151P4A8_ALLMI|nr:RRP15-like protein [Alligator mississippiensis]